MHINPITATNTNYPKYNAPKISRTRFPELPQINFNGNYREIYNIARSRDFQKQYSMVEQTFKDLFRAAILEPTRESKFLNLIDTISLRYTTENFQQLNTSAEEIVIKSTTYDVPLLTTRGGVLSFHDPINGEFGNGNISFWIDRYKRVSVSRPKDYHEFHRNKVIREFYRKIEDGGGIIDQKYYNENGKESFWKNLF